MRMLRVGFKPESDINLFRDAQAKSDFLQIATNLFVEDITDLLQRGQTMDTFNKGLEYSHSYILAYVRRFVASPGAYNESRFPSSFRLQFFVGNMPAAHKDNIDFGFGIRRYNGDEIMHMHTLLQLSR